MTFAISNLTSCKAFKIVKRVKLTKGVKMFCSSVTIAFLSLISFEMKTVVRTLTSLSSDQEVQHLSDANGTSIVSSHYTGERTTIKPIKHEAETSIRCVILKLSLGASPPTLKKALIDICSRNLIGLKLLDVGFKVSRNLFVILWTLKSEKSFYHKIQSMNIFHATRAKLKKKI